MSLAICQEKPVRVCVLQCHINKEQGLVSEWTQMENMHAMVLLLLVKIGAVRKWFSTVTSQKEAGEKQEPFGSKICLAKVLATTNFGTQLVGIQKNSPPHKVLAKILVKNLANILAWPSFGKTNFGIKLIRPQVTNKVATVS